MCVMDESIKDIVERVSRMDAQSRRAFLDTLSGSDPELHKRVRRFLQSDESVTMDFSRDERTSSVQAGIFMASDRQPRVDGEWIGEFRVLRELGSGAMGRVYLAEQQSPKREVALKVMRTDMVNETRLRRFELESESLAKLRHPGIATIYGSGHALIDGAERPYFAMELVEGRTLDAAASSMTTRARLLTLAGICDAIDHAHRRGVVHRDLKPANVMVDKEGRTKVLDFGVAKSLDDGSAKSELVGTLPYMSPEQLRGDADIDWRTDIYALGVMISEVLSGRRPHDLEGMTVDDAVPVVERRRDLGYIGDPALRAVVAHAIDPDKEQRYGSAADLGEDIRAYLSRRPVSVLSGSALYRARCFVRRQRVPVMLGVVAIVALTGGVAGTVYQAARATRGWDEARVQRDEAERSLGIAQEERASAFAANKFLVDMLVSADPESALGSDLTVREVLDTASQTIGSELDGSPLVHTTIRMALSNTYLSLGELEKALAHAEQMVQVAVEDLGDDHVQTADAKRTLAGVLMQLGDHERASTLLDEAAPVIEGLGDPVESARFRSERARVARIRGDQEGALALWRSSVEALERALGASHKETLIVMHNMGVALKDLGRLGESEEVLRRVVGARERTLGSSHPQTLVARDVLAGVVQKLGRDGEAAEILRDVLERHTEVLGPDHFRTLLSKGNLAVTLIRLGELDRAERLTREALAGYRERFGDSHARTLVLLGNLAYILEDQGELEEAAVLYREAIGIRNSATSGVNPETWAPMNNLAMLLMRDGKPGEALPIFKDLLAMCDAALPEGHYYTAIFRNNMAQCYIDLGRGEEALAAIESTHPVLLATFGEGHERVVKSEARRAAAEALVPGE